MLTGYGILIFWLIVAAVALLASVIHTAIAEGGFDFIDIGDFFESYFECFAWLTFLIVCAIGAIVFGFLNWYWWAMLLIILGVISIPIIIVIVIVAKGKQEDKEWEENSKKKTEHKEQTSYNCPNCGAKIVKITITDLNGNSEIKHKCEHCGSVMTKRQMLGIQDPDIELQAYDLDDWEEEYFIACLRMNFKPHNHHTQKQIDKRQESIQAKIDDGEEIYEDEEEYDEDILNEAYEFFTDNVDEIQEYLKKYPKEEIQKRFKYFCFTLEEDDEEEE